MCLFSVLVWRLGYFLLCLAQGVSGLASLAVHLGCPLSHPCALGWPGPGAGHRRAHHDWHGPGAPPSRTARSGTASRKNGVAGPDGSIACRHRLLHHGRGATSPRQRHAARTVDARLLPLVDAGVRSGTGDRHFYLLGLARLLVFPLGCPMKIVVHRTGDGLRHARRQTECFKRCLTDLLQAPEVPQELGLTLLTHAWDVFQSRTQLLALAQRLVIGDGKAVCFVTHPL